MQNWKDYVGVQQVNPDSLKLHYFITDRDDDGLITISMKTVFFMQEDLSIPEESIGDVIEQILLTFPVWEGEPDSVKVNIQIAANTRRGVGNRTFKTDNSTIQMYTQDHDNYPQYDCPIIVCHIEGESNYFVFKHPKFEEYGFIVND